MGIDWHDLVIGKDYLFRHHGRTITVTLLDIVKYPGEATYAHVGRKRTTRFTLLNKATGRHIVAKSRQKFLGLA